MTTVQHASRLTGRGNALVPCLLACLLLGLAPGCQSGAESLPAVTREQIVALTREGKPVEEIVHEIRRSRTIYDLKAVEVKEHLDGGVDERVVDYMMETRIRDLEERYRRMYYYYPRLGFYWGYPYYY